MLPFRTERSGVIGRLVRLGPAVDEILSHHKVPLAVAQALGEAVALTVMLGTSLKFDGKLILQTKTDGILDFLVINFETPGRVRGYVRYDKKRFSGLDDETSMDQGELLGAGIWRSPSIPARRWSAIRASSRVDGEGLAAAALGYFQQSEQLPSFIRLAVARHYQARRMALARRRSHDPAPGEIRRPQEPGRIGRHYARSR